MQRVATETDPGRVTTGRAELNTGVHETRRRCSNGGRDTREGADPNSELLHEASSYHGDGAQLDNRCVHGGMLREET